MLDKQIVKPIQEFGLCLKGILTSRGISASELARTMAYKSRNSIFRILDDVGGQSARQAFFDRLTSEDPLGLDDEEKAALEQALEVSRVGRHAFLSNRAIYDMLMSAELRMHPYVVRIDHVGSEDDPDFRMALEEMARGRKAYAVITGCCDKTIFEAIRQRIHRTDVTCEVRIIHLIYTGAEEIVSNISAIQPLLYSDCYTAYCVEPGVFGKERESLFRQNCIYVQVEDQQGEWRHQTFSLVDKGVFMTMGRMHGAENERIVRYFEEDLRRMPLLKAQLPAGDCAQSYLSYIESCRKLEMNRNVYTIKPDISLACIHPDILLPCVKEEFWQMAGGETEEIKAAFYRTHLARWENFFGTRRSNHMILSREAMESFARTGRQSDHFFAIRTYTPEERAEILAQLKRQMLENPNFCLHFFKEAYRPPMTEIGLYEGAGTLMTKPQTHYNLAGDHAEAVITQKEFCERYREFFVQDLLERCVISVEETLTLMDQLIRIAREAA